MNTDRMLTLVIALASAVSSGLHRVLLAETVEGHVYYADGKPVAGASVYFHSFGAHVGISKPAEKTDVNGHYSLTLEDTGEGVITASKEEEGFPDAALVYYGRFGHSSIKTITVGKDTYLTGVDLYFGEPYVVADYEITDTSGKPISNARLLVRLTSNPKYFGSYSVPQSGHFEYVLPREVVFLAVSAPGFQTLTVEDVHGTVPSNRKIVQKLQLQRASAR